MARSFACLLALSTTAFAATVATAALADTTTHPHLVPGAATPAQIKVRTLKTLPDIAIKSAAPRKLKLTQIAPDVDWARPSPDGKTVVVGTNEYTARIADGVAGEARLFPGNRAIPVKRVADEHTVAFNAGGTLLAVTSELNPTPLSRPKTPATPKISILEMPSLKVIARVDGVEPRFIGDREIALRRGRQAFRFPVDGTPTAVGKAQPLACLPEGFPLVRCQSSTHTSFIRPDPGMTRWLAIFDDGRANERTLRLLPFGDPKQARDLISYEDKEQSMRPIAISPDGARFCGFLHNFNPKRSTLYCVAIASGQVEQLYSAQPDVDSLKWLDADRVVFADKAPVIVDVAKRTITRVTGLPSGAAQSWVTPLAGGKRLVAHWSDAAPLVVIDLDAKTYATTDSAPLGKGGGPLFSVEAPAKNSSRFVVMGRHGDDKRRASWVDI